MADPGGTRGRLRVPIGAILVAGFGGLVLAAVAAVLAVGLRGTGDATRELLQVRAEALLSTVAETIHDQLDPVEAQARWIAGQVAAGAIDPADAARFDTYLMGALAATPQITGISVVLMDGSQRRYHRGSGQVIAGDEETRRHGGEMLRRPDAAPAPAWEPPFWSPALRETLIILRTPLARAEAPVGVLLQSVRITDLSRALSERLGGGLTPFVLYGAEWVLAHPRLSAGEPGVAPGEPLPRLAAVEDPVLAALPTALRRPPPMMGRLAEGESFRIDLARNSYVVLLHAVEGLRGLPVTAGVHFDHLLHGTDVRRLMEGAVTGLAVLVVAVAAAIAVGIATGRPIRRLAEAAQAVRGGRLEAAPRVPQSPLREIDDAAEAFNGMVAGLRERDRIRTLFGKFVPEEVAERLLSEEGGFAPRTVEATVLFADLVDFTRRSETMAPEAVVAMLNAYFSTAVEILERHKGVVTQFQGDAVLATFNVPVADPGHAAEAVAAARELLAALAERTFDGHRLRCRIGIATGTVVAGNVGAQDRLGYTVHGDAVNLASRLEVKNKDFGTAVLIADTTAALAPGAGYRRIGEIAVRGRERPVTVFTLSDVPPALQPAG